MNRLENGYLLSVAFGQISSLTVYYILSNVQKKCFAAGNLEGALMDEEIEEQNTNCPVWAICRQLYVIPFPLPFRLRIMFLPSTVLIH